MSNVKWSGIEKSKYGLTARWYGSLFYGNDIDVDGVGLYSPSSNPNGHGGPTRPFATGEKLNQQGGNNVAWVLDSGVWVFSSKVVDKFIIGDGSVQITNNALLNGIERVKFHNITILSSGLNQCTYIDSKAVYSAVSLFGEHNLENSNSLIVECSLLGARARSSNVSFVRCSGILDVCGSGGVVGVTSSNNAYIGCSDLILRAPSTRPVGLFADHSTIIGTVKTSVPVNGKTTGVTIEDFKADGNYFSRSFSEVDLFGNPSGSGATTPQLQTLFCNYFSPVYIDNWQALNLHMKPTAPDIMKYGGLNGAFIGALPIMHFLTAETLFNDYMDAVNSSNIELDAVSKAMKIEAGETVGVFRSTRINLPKPITGNAANFYANLVYNIEGTIKEGVANQRIDTTPDLLPDNTKNQRVVYDFRLAIAPDNVAPMGTLKNYELDRAPTIDADGNSNVDDLFNQATETKQEIGAFMIEFTMRKIIID